MMIPNGHHHQPFVVTMVQISYYQTKVVAMTETVTPFKVDPLVKIRLIQI